MSKYLYAWKTQVGYVQIIFAALIYGTFGLFVRALDHTPEYILFYRFFFGLIGLLVFISVKDGLASVKPVLVHWRWMVVPALLTGLSWLAYTHSLSYTSVANAAFLIYTAPVFTVIFAPLILKENLEYRTVAALIISLLGTASIMGYSSLFSSGTSLLGDLYALFGGITYGFLALFLKKAPPGVLGLPSNIIMSGFIAIGFLPFALKSISQFSWNGILILLALGIFQQTFGSTLFHLGLRKVKAQHAGILTYVEPLAATILAALFLYEGITMGSILGGALIITGGLIVVLRSNSHLAAKLPRGRGF